MNSLIFSCAVIIVSVNADEAKKASEKDEFIAAGTIWQEYGGNEVAADEKYKGKTIKISGPVHSVRKAADGRYMIGFYVVDPVDAEGRKYPPNIVCYIADGSQKDFAAFKAGQTAKVTGKVVGRKSAVAYEGYIVVAAECRIAK